MDVVLFWLNSASGVSAIYSNGPIRLQSNGFMPVNRMRSLIHVYIVCCWFDLLTYVNIYVSRWTQFHVRSRVSSTLTQLFVGFVLAVDSMSGTFRLISHIQKMREKVVASGWCVIVTTGEGSFVVMSVVRLVSRLALECSGYIRSFSSELAWACFGLRNSGGRLLLLDRLFMDTCDMCYADVSGVLSRSESHWHGNWYSLA